MRQLIGIQLLPFLRGLYLLKKRLGLPSGLFFFYIRLSPVYIVKVSF